MMVLTLESVRHQVETKTPKMEVTRLSDPMSRVPVFKEPQPRVMIDKSANLNKKVRVCPRIETLRTKGLFINDVIMLGGYRDPPNRHFLATPPHRACNSRHN